MDESSKPTVGQRFDAWFATIPEWARPPIYGSGLVLLFAIPRIVVFGPIAALLVAAGVLKGGASEVALVAKGLGLATLGGAIAGVSYSIVGRYLRGIPWVGAYLAGVVIMPPYVTALIGYDRLRNGIPLLAALSHRDATTVGVLSVLIGLMLGHIWFRQDRKAVSSAARHAS